MDYYSVSNHELSHAGQGQYLFVIDTNENSIVEEYDLTQNAVLLEVVNNNGEQFAIESGGSLSPSETYFFNYSQYGTVTFQNKQMIGVTDVRIDDQPVVTTDITYSLDNCPALLQFINGALRVDSPTPGTNEDGTQIPCFIASAQ